MCKNNKNRKRCRIFSRLMIGFLILAMIAGAERRLAGIAMGGIVSVAKNGCIYPRADK